jgi:Mor family transcriptional regulator
MKKKLRKKRNKTIVAAYKDGETVLTLAKIHDLSPQQIYNILIESGSYPQNKA